MVKQSTSSINWGLSALGGLASSASLISLIQSWGQYELSSHLTTILEFYRSITRTIFGWIPLPFGWDFPDWYLDVMSIALILSLIHYRTEQLAPLNFSSNVVEHSTKSNTGVLAKLLPVFLCTLFAPLAFVGVVMSLGKAAAFSAGAFSGTGAYNILPSGEVQSLQAHGRLWIKTFRLQIIVMIVSVLLFYLTNSGL